MSPTKLARAFFSPRALRSIRHESLTPAFIRGDDQQLQSLAQFILNVKPFRDFAPCV